MEETPVKYLMLIYGNQEEWASIPARTLPDGSLLPGAPGQAAAGWGAG